MIVKSLQEMESFKIVFKSFNSRLAFSSSQSGGRGEKWSREFMIIEYVPLLRAAEINRQENH